MLLLVHSIIGILAIIAVGMAVWRSVINWSVAGTVGHWMAVITLLIAYSASGNLMNSQDLTRQTTVGNAGGSIVSSNLFPDTYTYKEKRESVTASEANTVVNQLSGKGVAIAIGIWNGMSQPLDALGGANIFVMVVGLGVIILIWRFVISQDHMQLILGLLMIALVISFGAGSPVEAWFPRSAVALANELVAHVNTQVKDVFVAIRVNEEGLLSKLELTEAANHARVFPKMRDALRLYVSSARQQGLPVESLGMVGIDDNGRVPDGFESKLVVYTPGEMADLAVTQRLVAEGYDGVRGSLHPLAKEQEIPKTILDIYDTSGYYAIYLGGDPNQFITKYLHAPGYGTIFFPSGNMPPTAASDQAAADALWAGWERRLIDGVEMQIGVVLLEGDSTKAMESLRKAIQVWYAKAKPGCIKNVKDYFARVKAARAGNEGTEALDAQEKCQLEILEQWCMAPNVQPLQFKESLKISLEQPSGVGGSANMSLGVAVRSALWQSSNASPGSVPPSPIVGRDGPSLSDIIKNKNLQHPDAWGVILRGVADGSYKRVSGLAIKNMDILRESIAEVVGDPYGEAKPPVVAMGGFFTQPQSREFGRSVKVMATEDSQGWFSKIVSAVVSFGAWLTAFSIYYIVSAVVSILAAIAVAWAPMVVGVSLMFVVALWPVVFCFALMPGRWTLFFDWFKVVLWVFGWVPVIILGRGMIDADGLVPTGSYTFAVIQKLMGLSVIMAAPIIAKVIIDPSIGGLSGIIGFAMKQVVSRAGMLTGGAIGVGLAATNAVKAVAQSGPAAAAGTTGAPGSEGAAPGTPGSSGDAGGGTPGGSPGGDGSTSSSRTTGGSVQSNGSGGGSPGGGDEASGKSFLGGMIGGDGDGRIAGGAKALARNLADQAKEGALEAKDRFLPQSPVSAGDRMGAAAVAALSGDPAEPGNQWRGFGKTVSNRDMRGGGGGGGKRSGSAAGGTRRKALAGIDAKAQKGAKSLGKSRILASQAHDIATEARSEATTGDPRQASAALVDAGLAETMVAEHESDVAAHPDASPAEQQAASARADGARQRATNHLAAAGTTAANTGDKDVKAAIEAAIAAVGARLAAASPRAVGSAPKGNS